MLPHDSMSTSQPSRELELPLKLKELDCCIGSLEGTVNVLIGRLSPICTSLDERKPSADKPADPRSHTKITSELQMFIYRIDSAKEQLLTMIEHLEI